MIFWRVYVLSDDIFLAYDPENHPFSDAIPPFDVAQEGLYDGFQAVYCVEFMLICGLLKQDLNSDRG